MDVAFEKACAADTSVLVTDLVMTLRLWRGTERAFTTEGFLGSVFFFAILFI